jgi:hypothetical protein
MRGEEAAATRKPGCNNHNNAPELC